MKLSNCAKIVGGNCLMVPCQGNPADGHECPGTLRVPFVPPLPGFLPLTAKLHWKRESGESLADLTLTPSVQMEECGHFYVTNGEIVRC